MKNFLIFFFMLFTCSVAFGEVSIDPASPTDTAGTVTMWIAVISSCAWAICEALVRVPAIKANSFFQLISSIFKTLSGK